MKKFTKTLTASVLAVAASTSLFAIPADHVAYADETPSTVVKGDVITAKELPSAGNVGKPVYIPKAESTALGGGAGSISTIEAIVTRPDGRKQTLQDATSNWTFTPSMAGTYKLQYKGTSTAGVTTLSEVFYIKVTADNYEMKIKSNGDIILPSTVDTKASRYENNTVKSVVLPNPTVYDKNGYVIYENGAVNTVFARYEALPGLIASATDEEKPALEAELAKIEAEFHDHNITSEEINLYKGCKLDIEVTTESKVYTIGGENALTLANGNYSFVPEQGTNVIRYVFKTAAGTNLQSMTRTIVGSDTYDHTKINLGWEAADRPTTASLNEIVRLPLAKAYNKADANSSVSSKTIMKVTQKVITDGSVVETDVEIGEDEDGFYFIPTVKDANYTISYNVVDFYGNKGTEYSYTIEKVVDGKAPTLYIVRAFDYTTTADAIIKMQRAEYMIPTTVSREDNEIVFPAMFGKDSVTEYDSLTFYRSITSTVLDGSINLLDNQYLKALSGEEAEDVSNITKQNEKAAHEAVLNLKALKDDGTYKYPAGEYTVTYTVRDGNSYSASRSFTFTIKEEFEDTEKPTITYADNFPTLVQKGQDVKFAKPTVVDSVDSRLKVNYYVTVGTYDVEIFESEDEEGYIIFNMSDYVTEANDTIYNLALANGNKITVKTVAVDSHNNTATESVEITVRNANDTDAATIKESTGADFASGTLPTISNSYRQGSIVSVAGVTITDNDANLTIIATVRDASGNKVYGVQALGAIEKKTVGGMTTYAHPGVQFTATKAESYTVTYTAVDAGNNVVAYTVKLPTLTDSEKPVITGVTSGKVYEIELGQKLDLGRVTVIDNVDTGLVATLTCDAHPEYINGTIFAPTEVGTYVVKYNAKDSEGNEADTVTVEVKVTDTTAPTLTINNKDEYGTTIKSQTTITDNTQFTAIKLPTFSAEDNTYDFGLDAGALNMYAKGEIKISAPDGNTYTVDNTNSKYKINYSEVEDVYTFVPTTKGTYTVTYSAVDASGNKAEDYVIKVMVGDTVLPTIDYTGTIDANLKVGDVLKLDETKISITDNLPPASEEDGFSYTITLEDASGKSVEYVKEGEDEKIRAYTFTTAGTYTLTITAKDAAGNSNTYTYKINVTTNASKTSIKDNVTGIVLIVVSLLILGGVIIYFAKGKKKVSPKKTVKKIEKKDKPEEIKD